MSSSVINRAGTKGMPIVDANVRNGRARYHQFHVSGNY